MSTLADDLSRKAVEDLERILQRTLSLLDINEDRASVLIQVALYALFSAVIAIADAKECPRKEILDMILNYVKKNQEEVFREYGGGA